MTEALAVNLEASCWLWAGAKNSDGYGHLSRGNKTVDAHRYLWTLMRGPIPKGRELDHLCGVRACVNALHMQVVYE